MAKLTSKQRNKLSRGSFALSGRRYPIEDKSHARNALARVSQHGSPEEKKKVREAVHRKYPRIGNPRLGKGKKGKAQRGHKKSARKRA